MSETREDAVALIAEALQIEPAEVDERTALGVTPQWDSLAHMRLILALEDRLGRRLEPEEIVSVAGIEDVTALLERERC